MVFRPVRERSADCILELIRRSLEETGYEEVSLFSLNTTDYSCLKRLLPSLMGHLEKGKISLSLPSIRTDGLDLSILNQIKRVRKTGLTLAPEAGSQRLRDVINKGLDEESVLGAARAAASAGWEGMKLYFMIGLPGEKEEDLLEIVRLSREALRAGRAEKKGKFHLTVSLSSFIPKPHTPFQWVGQAPVEELREKLNLLRDRMRKGGLTLKWQSPEMSFLEAVFSRGDRALGQTLAQAHALGCGFDGWTERLRFDLWEKAFSLSNVDPYAYSSREFEPGSPLPWDHISVGLSRGFLLREYQKAQAGEVSLDCQVGGCLQCGLECSPAPRPAALSALSPSTLALPEGIAGPQERGAPADKSRIRFRFQKGEEARFLSHLEILRTLSRAARRSQIPLCYSQGFHPQPRLRIAWALPVGVCGEEEWGEMELEGKGSIREIEESLNRHLPLGLRIREAEEVPLSSPPVDMVFSQARYEILLGDEAGLARGVQNSLPFSAASPPAFLEEVEIMASTRRKGRELTVDLKPLILDFFRQGSQTLPSWQLTLRLSPEGGIHPARVMARFFSNYLDEEEAAELVLGLKINRKTLL
jgi:radical SAM-linked protein